MAEKGADTLIELRADDVLEFAGLCLCFGVVDGEGVFEEALGQAMTANNVAGAATSVRCEPHFAVVHFH
jgi:hypothetical protein